MDSPMGGGRWLRRRRRRRGWERKVGVQAAAREHVAEGRSLEEEGIPGCLRGVWAHIDGSGLESRTAQVLRNEYSL